MPARGDQSPRYEATPDKSGYLAIQQVRFIGRRIVAGPMHRPVACSIGWVRNVPAFSGVAKAMTEFQNPPLNPASNHGIMDIQAKT
jgi:hypothetical protein